jgi:hypothetical protein
MGMSNNWPFPELQSEIAILKQIVNMIQVTFGSQDPPGNTEGLVEKPSSSLQMENLIARRQVFGQSLSDKGTVINHDDSHR